MADSKELFDNRTLHMLEQMMLMAPRVRAGMFSGERRSIKRGSSLEFADYRNYNRGDDLRRLDWNIFGRTGRPVTKVFENEEDLAVHIIIDMSKSMAWPEEGEGPMDENKSVYARRLAAGLASVSLASNDLLRVTALCNGKAVQYGPARGRAHSVRIRNFIAGLEADGVTDLNDALRDYAMQTKRPGLCIIISDMFSPTGHMDGLNALLNKGYEVAVFHVLSPDEVTPKIGGDLRLVDVETGASQEVSIDEGMRQLYMQNLANWRDGMKKDLTKRGMHYLPVETSRQWFDFLLQDLRRDGMAR